MIPGRGTPEGTAAYAKRHAAAHPQHWRQALGLTLSSVGMGTYLGNADPVSDGKYAASAEKALSLGINVIDSAINYRYQRSERNIGAGLKKAVDAGLVKREEIVLCTKGGFIAGDWGPPTREWFEESFVKPGVLQPGDIVAGCHCMTPKYLKHEVDQSRANLGVETIDVYHVHNPETQMPEVGPEEYYQRLTDAFRALEECVAEGKIGCYGTATWHAYRVAEGTESYASLEKTAACARAAGGEKHHFRAIQFPLNLAMPEAHLQKTQGESSALAAAQDLGLTVFTSVPLMQGQLLGRFSKDLKSKFPGLETDAQRCIQFARSTPGVAVPVPGMKAVEHVEENAKVASVAPFTADEFSGLLSFLGA